MNISIHAKERMITRMRVSRNKIKKVVRKALLSNNQLPPAGIHAKKMAIEKYKNQYIIIKYFMGYIFVFGDNDSLITLYNPNVYHEKFTING